jgi:holin-like protein
MIALQQLMRLIGFGLIGHLAAMIIPLPALILAMLTLFMSLKMGWIKKENIELISIQLIAISGMFFIPMIVGILEYWPNIGHVFFSFLVVVTMGTLLPLAITAIVLEKLIHRQDAKEAKRQKDE